MVGSLPLNLPQSFSGLLSQQMPLQASIFLPVLKWGWWWWGTLGDGPCVGHLQEAGSGRREIAGYQESVLGVEKRLASLVFFTIV